MSEPTVHLTRAASELQRGDRIAASFLPASTHPATVVWVDMYPLNGRNWAFLVWQYSDGGREGGGFLEDALIPLESSADDGYGYSREADDSTPISAIREPLHTGAVVDGGRLVDETEPPAAGVVQVAGGHVVHECCGKLDGGPCRTFCAQYRAH